MLKIKKGREKIRDFDNIIIIKVSIAIEKKCNVVDADRGTWSETRGWSSLPSVTGTLSN